jgi:predicted Rossmann-fold nucleotide-binding protein
MQAVVFISYARESEDHRAWVRGLAERLRLHDIEIRLDEWHLSPGDDLAAFMVSAIRDSNFVLLICTPNYANKAHANQGGVGFEGAIISGSLLTFPDVQAKFIPLLRSGTAAESIPAYLWNRLWVDFTDDRTYSAAVEQLARHLSRRPENTPPPVAPTVTDGPATQSAARPDRWMLVAGTGNRERLPDELETLCDRIGAKLAERRFGLVTGGWQGVDLAVSVSFSKRLESLGLPLENFLTQVVEHSWSPPFRAGRIVPVPKGEAEYIESVKRADAAILIGGVGGTYRTAEYMRISGKPVFPVPKTGGDARKFFKRMLKKWYEGCIPGITSAQYASLDANATDPISPLLDLLDAWNRR